MKKSKEEESENP